MKLEIFKDIGVEILLPSEENFLKIKETLTRIGVVSKKSNILYPSCVLLHKKGKYGIFHFKEMFLLDGREATLDENDIGRRNTIVNLLAEWKLLTIPNLKQVEKPLCPVNKIKIISFKEKENFQIENKYIVGIRKE